MSTFEADKPISTRYAVALWLALSSLFWLCAAGLAVHL
jgi:hypothetical protein